ncbi:MAG: MarR family transcriptional regulator [Pseudomonadota bacterium]
MTNRVLKENDGSSSNRFCFVLERANRVISRRLNGALRPTGLTSRQLVILGTIAEHGPLRQKALAEQLGKDHATVTANLVPLTRRGLVSREEDGSDRRALRVSLTRDGNRLLGQARGLVESFEADLGTHLREEDALGKLCTALKTLL